MKILQGVLTLCLVAAAMAAPSENALQQVSRGANQFATNFYGQVANRVQGNLICSPLSADIVLAMASYGSGGNTERQFNRVLHLPQSPEVGRSGYRSLISVLNNVQNVELQVANKVFVGTSYPVKQSYKEITANDFHSTSQELNFANSEQSADIINKWVAENTNNYIKDIIQSSDLSSDTAMVLVNAIYFKGKWHEKFDKTLTAPKTFHLSKTQSIDVPTMYKESDFKYGDISGLDAKFIELPYEGDEVKMVIILPNEIDGLSKVERKLDQVNLNTLLNNVPERTVRLFLPKFKIESTIELNEVLQSMGLSDMFSQAHANFSGISDVPTYVSKVIQKAFIEVNEEGTKAAAATGLVVELMMDDSEDFEVDRPFAYAILHKKQGVPDANFTTIFKGHVAQLPKTEKRDK